MFELAKQFRFEAAHTLPGRAVDTDPSRRIHGHSYRAEVVVRGAPDPATGMVVDLGLFERALGVARDFFASVKLTGRPWRDDAGSGVVLTGRAEGVACEATWSRGGLRWFCSCCQEWRRLAVQIEAVAGDPVAFFVLPAVVRAGAV